MSRLHINIAHQNAVSAEPSTLTGKGERGTVWHFLHIRLYPDLKRARSELERSSELLSFFKSFELEFAQFFKVWALSLSEDQVSEKAHASNAI